MINLLLILMVVPGLVLLYSQWKIKGQQEELIKAEAESLRRLQLKNRRFVETGLFGLEAKSSYLQTPTPKEKLAGYRRQLLSPRFSRKRKGSSKQQDI